MLNVQEALVFGPPSTGILACLITVASIGTITFGIEIGNFIEKVSQTCCGILDLITYKPHQMVVHWAIS